MSLSVNYMGLKLNNPVMAASSGLTTQKDKVLSFARAGVGAIVLKSLFEEQISNEALFLEEQSMNYPESSDYLHFYLKQNSLDKYLQLVNDTKALVNVPVIASINCYSLGEWTDFAKKIEAAGADGLELNLYTLPLDIHKKSEEIESQYLNVVKRVSSSVKIPVAVKIANNFTNLPGFTENLKAYGAKGVVMFNRLYTPDIDISNLRLIPSDAFSHSEEYVKELRWMAIISSLVNNIDLSASTGIHNGTTAIKQILAGAKTVQMCTALYKEGADVIVHTLEDIQLFMDKQGFNSVDEFRGKLNYKNIQNPDKFERVQFMKNFGSK